MQVNGNFSFSYRRQNWTSLTNSFYVTESSLHHNFTALLLLVLSVLRSYTSEWYFTRLLSWKGKERKSKADMRLKLLISHSQFLPCLPAATEYKIVGHSWEYMFILPFFSQLLRSWSFLLRREELSTPLLTLLCPSAHMKSCRLLHS